MTICKYGPTDTTATAVSPLENYQHVMAMMDLRFLDKEPPRWDQQSLLWAGLLRSPLMVYVVGHSQSGLSNKHLMEVRTRADF